MEAEHILSVCTSYPAVIANFWLGTAPLCRWVGNTKNCKTKRKPSILLLVHTQSSNPAVLFKPLKFQQMWAATVLSVILPFKHYEKRKQSLQLSSNVTILTSSINTWYRYSTDWPHWVSSNDTECLIKQVQRAVTDLLQTKSSHIKRPFSDCGWLLKGSMLQDSNFRHVKIRRQN